ncbi:hypothetical protein BFS14_01900 [Serratia fonticola]|uniref:DUF4752 family protein n=1 Tax=Serratia fonticola TaxID=47917 RepID=UPI0008FD8A51|nr:DUF4752 family protein [Serratia fonticola]OIX96241.1 hypothetical protein BFS14_01900 [Serratia fonticola]QCR60837.1 DUF4752 family protein [Serratia fonticola]
MKELSFYDWMTMGLMAIGYVYIITRAVHWLIVILAKRFDRFRFRKSPRQLAVNALHDAFDLRSIRPGKWITIELEDGLSIRIAREKQDGEKA